MRLYVSEYQQQSEHTGAIALRARTVRQHRVTEVPKRY
jgi:hypothetical protein